MNQLVVLGYSGHSFVVIEVAQSMGIEIIGYLDFKESQNNYYKLPFLGKESEFNNSELIKNAIFFPAVGNNEIRKKMLGLLRANSWKETILIDKSAQISKTTQIGQSTLVCPKVVINSQANIGEGCILNTGAIIEHEVKIGNYSHISPGAILLGACQIGDNCHIGAGAIIKQGVIISDHVIVGAGAVVLNNISEGQTWIGNPAKQLIKT
jgi:sugar O-acyltransferase (sialic acid O-acetyltransferase NeuD family)